MTQDQVLLIVLVVLVVANVFLVATMPLRMRRRQRATRDARAQTGALDPSSDRADPGITDDTRVVAAIEAFVDGTSADATGLAAPPAPSDPMAGSRQWTVDDLGDSSMWTRAIREESARAARYGHPVTVVMAELPHLKDLADRFGPGIADRVTTEAAHSLRSESRAVDRIAWLGGARFGVLLPQTEEIAAGAYVERVRAAADGWLESTGLSIRMSLGWASPADGGDVAAAAVAAEQRMHDAERRPRPSPTIISRATGTPDPPGPPRRRSQG